MSDRPDTYQLLDMAIIDPPANTSRFDADDPAITNLAQSIHTLGLLQPIIVTPAGDRYRLVAGQRRYRACQLLGFTQIPAHVTTLNQPDEALATVTENLQRAQLAPLEEAAAIQDLLSQHAISQADLAGMLGVDRTWISHRIALLRLPEDLLDALVLNNLAPTIALELDRIEKDADRQYYLNMVVTSGATLATVRDWVRTYLTYQQPQPTDTDAAPAPIDVPPVPEQPLPACLACGATPPQVQLRMAYLCFSCERALRNASRPQ